MGVDQDEYWEHVVKSMDTLCIYMGVSKLPEICGRLMRHGLKPTTPIALIEWGTTERQRTVTGTLEDIIRNAKDFENPSMIVVGEVVRLRDKLQWYEQLQDEQQFQLAAHVG